MEKKLILMVQIEALKKEVLNMYAVQALNKARVKDAEEPAEDDVIEKHVEAQKRKALVGLALGARQIVGREREVEHMERELREIVKKEKQDKKENKSV